MLDIVKKQKKKQKKKTETHDSRIEPSLRISRDTTENVTSNLIRDSWLLGANLVQSLNGQYYSFHFYSDEMAI